MSVLDQLDERELERFSEALVRKLGELAAEFPELEEAGRKIDPDTLLAPISYQTQEERDAHDALMA